MRCCRRPGAGAPATWRRAPRGRPAFRIRPARRRLQRAWPSPCSSARRSCATTPQLLEDRVADRTQALRQANARLEAEIQERRNTEAALLQAQKLQAVGQLAGGIAHDFNNVLQAVLGGVALIAKRAGDPAAVARLTGMVEEAAQRGQSITRRLLAFSRREELRADRLDVGALLVGLREVLAATLGAAHPGGGARRRPGCRRCWPIAASWRRCWSTWRPMRATPWNRAAG